MTTPKAKLRNAPKRAYIAFSVLAAFRWTRTARRRWCKQATHAAATWQPAPQFKSRLLYHHLLLMLRKMVSAAANLTGTQATPHTLVIGAGWSGLIAALRLAEAGRRVTVIEARERIGGRAFTHEFDAGEGKGQVKVDMGCSWMHGYEEGNPARALAERYSVVSVHGC